MLVFRLEKLHFPLPLSALALLTRLHLGLALAAVDSIFSFNAAN
jgi:hypothetical protein